MRPGARRLYWILGTAIALMGIVVARIVAPQLPEQFQSSAFVAGVTVAVTGIFVAAAGAGAAKRTQPPHGTSNHGEPNPPRRPS